mmetsp:Transcript_6091/g.8866  ORF Transcript_6091/g.8866 Transcript_6091/m.8866 type:complete len:120 (-) Transcript_6091:50-409(-)
MEINSSFEYNKETSIFEENPHIEIALFEGMLEFSPANVLYREMAYVHLSHFIKEKTGRYVTPILIKNHLEMMYDWDKIDEIWEESNRRHWKSLQSQQKKNFPFKQSKYYRYQPQEDQID